MWKEEFRIGNDVVDGQHKTLFEKAAELEGSINAGFDEKKASIIETIIFLKNYALKHFADEEAFAQSVNYPGFNEHQAQHKAFIQTVLAHEKEMKESDFSEDSVKKFSQTLKLWLLFHVTNSDRKIVGKDPVAYDPN